jgi:hypothetical protein
MLAMQYSIQLPVGYGSDKIRERVSQRSKLFDDHTGLVHKSFLYNEGDQIYAPFYVWKDVEQAQQFLLADLFKGVIEAFRRHRVRSWFVIHMAYGNRGLKPTFCYREIDVVPPEDRLDHFLAKEKQTHEDLLKDPNLYMCLIALDADRWEIVRFSLWKDKKSAPRLYSDCCHEYEVLHVSEPNTPVESSLLKI